MSRSTARPNPTLLQSNAVAMRVVSPPYDTIVPLDHFTARRLPLPLGAIVFGTDQSVLSRVSHAAVALMRDPWVIPCLVLPPGEDDHGWLRELVPTLGIRLAVVEVPDASSSVSISALLEAVRSRPSPDAFDLASYVTERLEASELDELLASQFTEALGGKPACSSHSIATFSRQFRRCGQFTARDWRAIARLVPRLTAPGTAESEEPGEPNGLCLASGRTLYRHVRKYLGMSRERAGQYLGWEWILERALREGSYATASIRPATVPTGFS